MAAVYTICTTYWYIFVGNYTHLMKWISGTAAAAVTATALKAVKLTNSCRTKRISVPACVHPTYDRGRTRAAVQRFDCYLFRAKEAAANPAGIIIPNDDDHDHNNNSYYRKNSL